MEFALTADPIETAPTVADASAGAYVVFEGRVRNLNEGRQVRSLEYEAFDEMAIKTGNSVLTEARERFPIIEVQCVHRTGHLQIGDIAIRVEVSSAHRKAGFEACGWIVDQIKKRVPIWKKEHYADGDSGWINCDTGYSSRAANETERGRTIGVSADEPLPIGNWNIGESPMLHPDFASLLPLGQLSHQAQSDKRYYERQVRLKEVGAEGQARLKNVRVLVVGAGGLGSSALLYLAAAGVGTLGIVEFDDLDESNLHRQVLYSTTEIGESKARAAARRLHSLNPHIAVVAHDQRVTRANVRDLFDGYDIVLDCTDNFGTKFLLNDACVASRKTLIQASIYQYEGQLLVIEPGSACLRCLWPQTPDEGCVGSCAEVGVLGVVPGLFGTLQANEAVKRILGLPSPLREGKMLLFDLLTYQQQMISIERNPNCPACGGGSPEVAAVCDLEASEIDLADYCVVDVRELEEVEAEPLNGSLNIPTSKFDPGLLPEADRYLLVCAHGIRSRAIAQYLRSNGDMRFFSLAGGLPTMRLKK